MTAPASGGGGGSAKRLADTVARYVRLYGTPCRLFAPFGPDGFGLPANPFLAGGYTGDGTGASAPTAPAYREDLTGPVGVWVQAGKTAERTAAIALGQVSAPVAMGYTLRADAPRLSDRCYLLDPRGVWWLVRSADGLPALGAAPEAQFCGVFLLSRDLKPPHELASLAAAA